MAQIVTLSIIVGGAILAALAASVGMAGASQLTSRRGHGYLHWIFYAILLTVALSELLSGRDLTTTEQSYLEHGDAVRPAFLNLLQPLITLLILTVAGERIISHWIRPQKDARVPVVLMTAFIIFWLGTVGASALFGAHPFISHDYVYPLVIGVAILLASGLERDLVFRAARDSLFIFMAVGLLMIPIAPEMVLDTGYTQGLIPGLPRFAGVAAHAVSLGVLVQVALLCLQSCPYQNRWLNRLAWMIGLASLFMAQSKTAWIAFIVCSSCIVLARKGPAFVRRAVDPLRKEVGVAAVLGFILLVIVAGVAVMSGFVDSSLSSFFDSAEGSQLTSLTGRDLIWAIAEDEWSLNPVFGYGPTIWDADFRTGIGMPNAVHAHNQFMDAISRSGTVGGIALVIYAAVLLFLSLRYTRVSGGLSLALFLALALRSVSEVPLSLYGYSTELITQLLLLTALSAGYAKTEKKGLGAPAARKSYPVPSKPLTSSRISP